MVLSCRESKSFPKFKNKIQQQNRGKAVSLGWNSFDRCKGLADSYFPDLQLSSPAPEWFPTWSVWRNGQCVTDLQGPPPGLLQGWGRDRRKGGADNGIWTKLCHILDVIRSPRCDLLHNLKVERENLGWNAATTGGVAFSAKSKSWERNCRCLKQLRYQSFLCAVG